MLLAGAKEWQEYVKIKSNQIQIPFSFVTYSIAVYNTQ